MPVYFPCVRHFTQLEKDHLYWFQISVLRKYCSGKSSRFKCIHLAQIHEPPFVHLRVNACQCAHDLWYHAGIRTRCHRDIHHPSNSWCVKFLVLPRLFQNGASVATCHLDCFLCHHGSGLACIPHLLFWNWQASLSIRRDHLCRQGILLSYLLHLPRILSLYHLISQRHLVLVRQNSDLKG